MDDAIFLSGSFAVYEGKTYRYKPIGTSLALFAPADETLRKRLLLVKADQITCRYAQSVQCDIKHVRHSAIAVREGTLYYRLNTSDRDGHTVPLTDCTEIWITREYDDGRTKTNVFWHHPDCLRQPSSERFYAEQSPNSRIFVHFHADTLSFEQTLETLLRGFGRRMQLKPQYTGVHDEEINQPFSVDGHDLTLAVGRWDVIGILPKQDNANPYILEIVDLLNQLSI